MSGIALSDVGVRFGQWRALSGVTLQLPGGVTVLAGPNGSGKTTLLRVLVGDICPDEGRVILDGATGGRAVPSIGWLPQSVRLPGHFTAIDYVAYCGWLQGLDHHAAVEEAQEVLARLAVAEVSQRRLRQLSGGVQRRVALAAATVHRPELVLLDEPTAGLDPQQRRAFWSWVLTYSADAHVVLSSHELVELPPSAARVVVLRGGQVVFDGDQHELRGRSADGSIGGGYDAVVGGG